MIKITRDHLTNNEVIELVSSHLQGMNLHSPESIHALNIESLKQRDITFWSVWEDSQLAGCGAIKELDEHHGEIKSMRTATAIVKGIAKELLQYIINEAQKRGYRRLSLKQDPRLLLNRLESYTPVLDFTSANRFLPIKKIHTVYL